MARILSGIDRYRVTEPLFEAVRIVLAHRGEGCTPAYVQGISGAAFRIAGICPCAPTCSSAMPPVALAEAFGYEVTRMSVDDMGIAPERLEDLAKLYDDGRLPPAEDLSSSDHRALREALDRIVDAVRVEVDAGRPAVVWHAFTMAENDVVAGYDDERGEFLGRGSYAGSCDDYARAPQLRLATSVLVGGWPGALLVGPKVRQPDMRAHELAALCEAVRHARTTPAPIDGDGTGWLFLEGLPAYDRWVRDFESPDKVRTAGDAYCYGVYRSTHAAAAAFLREIAPRHASLAPALEGAAACFEREVEALHAGEDLLWWQSPEGPDAARNRGAAEVLGAARTAYGEGIAAIAAALPATA